METADELPPVVRGVLAPGLDVLFVAFEPGPTDIRLGHHHARRNDLFWRLLTEAGLTPRQLSPEEDELLPAYGLGLKSVVGRRGRGSAGLDDVVTLCQPRILAFTGKGVYLAASGRTVAPWGRQAESIYQGVPDFVLPSPSGKARMRFDDRLRYYRELAEAVRQL